MRKEKVNQNSKYIFQEDIWITGILDGYAVIGRTVIKEQLQLVSYLKDNGTFGICKFDDIRQPMRLVTSIEKEQEKFINKVKAFINQN